jgi:hypothetical protein
VKKFIQKALITSLIILVATIVLAAIAFKFTYFTLQRKISNDLENDLRQVKSSDYCSGSAALDSVLEKHSGHMTSSPRRLYWDFLVLHKTDLKSNDCTIFSRVSRRYARKMQERSELRGMGEWHLYSAFISIILENQVDKKDLIRLACLDAQTLALKNYESQK